MKNNVVEILNFLFKKYAAHNQNQNTVTATAAANIGEEIMRQLQTNGYAADDIHDAFTWFVNLLMQQYLNNDNDAMQPSDAIRVFSPGEVDKAGKDGCSFILFLERVGVLSAKTREIVITQLLHLPQPQCSLDEIKWVILMVLLSHDDKKVGNQLLEKYALCLGQQYEC